MSFSIDRASGIPYYIQVRDTLQGHFQTGSWRPGDQLPGEPELCRMFGVSRTVIRQALNDLANKGLIVREKGRGTFVAETKIRESLVQKLTGSFQDMREQGHALVTQVLRQNVVPASQRVANYLQFEPNTPVIEIERLRFVDDVPLQLVTTYLPYTLCGGPIQQDLSRQSLYAFLEERFGVVIAHGHRSIEAVAANEYEARLLQVKKGAPLILLDSVSFVADGTPVEYYHALHRGDRTRFEVQLLRVRTPDQDISALEQPVDKPPPRSSFILRPESPPKGE